MSLLSELLAKVKHREVTSDVPPTLREDMLRSLQRRRAVRGWLVGVAATLVLVGAGIGLVWWLESDLGPTSILTRSALLTAGPKAAPTATPNAGVHVAQGPTPSEPPEAASSAASASPSEPPSSPVPAVPAAPPSASPPRAPAEPPSPPAPALAPPAEPARIPTPPAVPSRPQSSVPRARDQSADTTATPAGARQQNPADGSEEALLALPVTTPGPTEGERPEMGRAGAKTIADATTAGTSDAPQGVGAPGPGPESRPKSDLPAAPARTAKWDRDVYLYQASTCEAAGDFKRALASYRKVLAVEPKNYVVLNNVAGLLVRLGSYDEAIESVGKALAIKPNHVPSLVNMGIAYAQKGNQSAGEDCLRRALAVEPANLTALKTLAVLLEQKGALDEAGAVYAKLAHAGVAQGYLGMARIAEKQGKTEEAVKAYQALLLLDRVTPGDRALAEERVYQLRR